MFSRALRRGIVRAALRPLLARSYSTEPREAMEYDVVTVGAGPAGLCAAIRLKQLAAETGNDISVCVIEKGSEVGAHILSGNVFEPRALDELFPNWKDDEACPIDTPVTDDNFVVLLNDSKSFTLPSILFPKELHNHGNYVISLSQVTRWLGEKAEELGVEIYPGFAASEILYSEKGEVKGIATKDAGIAKDGKPKDTFARGMELRGRQTIFAEGTRGSCTEEIMKKFNLREGKHVQTYGIGIKEIWEVPDSQFKAGYVQHTLGWPLQDSLFSKEFGGSFMYHLKPNLVLLGYVVGLDYQNPYLNPYKAFQQWKHHPDVRKHFDGGECISYGARALNEGGYHAIPKLTFPGGALVGCGPGFMNSVKIKGAHTAMKSGMVAAEAIFEALTKDPSKTVAATGEINPEETPLNVTEYEARMEKSWVYQELKAVRNCHTAFHYGLLPGLSYTGFACHVTKGREPWTLPSMTPDSAKTGLKSQYKEIKYPKPDGKISFDILDNLIRSGTNHDHDQPSHLVVKEGYDRVPTDVSLAQHAGPEQRFCPALVYEYDANDKLVINAQNCVHCKTCDIKMPKEYVEWRVPEGGGGPGYTQM